MEQHIFQIFENKVLRKTFRCTEVNVREKSDILLAESIGQLVSNN